jgi:hypothetical protein
MMKGVTLTATRLRLILAVSLLLIEVIASIFVAYADTELKKYAEAVSHVRADSIASQNSVKTLRKIQQELLANKDAVERASDIVADSKSYLYQDQIITDLNDYAKRAGLTITNLDFSTPDPVGPTTTPTPTQPNAVETPTGVKTTSVSVTLKNPVNYEGLLKFIKSIEQNLTKMQISRIGLAKDTSNSVSSEILTIEVYIR